LEFPSTVFIIVVVIRLHTSDDHVIGFETEVEVVPVVLPSGPYPPIARVKRQLTVIVGPPPVLEIWYLGGIHTNHRRITGSLPMHFPAPRFVENRGDKDFGRVGRGKERQPGCQQ